MHHRTKCISFRLCTGIFVRASVLILFWQNIHLDRGWGCAALADNVPNCTRRAIPSVAGQSSFKCSNKNRSVPYWKLSTTLLIDVSKVHPQTKKPIPAAADTLWEVEVKTANPVHNTQETPLSKSIEAVLEVQMLMKGLLDLRRKDV